MNSQEKENKSEFFMFAIYSSNMYSVKIQHIIDINGNNDFNKSIREEPGPEVEYKFTGKERDSETGLYYYGARYLDGKTSRWLSADPALGDYVPGAPVDDEARKRNGNLPGMGGVFNTVNFHLYHYAGNNPVKYIDPDGMYAEITRKGNEINIVIPVKFANGTTDEQRLAFISAAVDSWSSGGNNRITKYDVRLTVEERNEGKYNTVTFEKDAGESYVDNFTDMHLFEQKSPEETIWVIGHEVGHLMNLEEKYTAHYNKNGERDYTKPYLFWGKNIMATGFGKAENRNIKEILEINHVTEDK